MIGIIAYGAGNLKSVQNALHRLDAKFCLLEAPSDFANVTSIILPGVGAFGPAMASLNHRGFSSAIRDWAAAGKPVLGICLGMQLLAQSSEENGFHDGLGLVNARIVKMKSSEGVRIPHVGWNSVSRVRDAKLWSGLERAICYHVHSFRFSFMSSEEEKEWAVGLVSHGEDFASMIERRNVMGVQFHPEKSQADGLAILRNFLSA